MLILPNHTASRLIIQHSLWPQLRESLILQCRNSLYSLRVFFLVVYVPTLSVTNTAIEWQVDL
jgi:hypothetical protein